MTLRDVVFVCVVVLAQLVLAVVVAVGRLGMGRA